MACKCSYIKISEENCLFWLKAANESGCREPKLRHFATNLKLTSDDYDRHGIAFLKRCLLHLKNLLSWDTNRPSSLSNYPYQESKIDEWFVESFTNGEQQKSVNIINVSKAGKENKIYDIQFGIHGFPMSLEGDDFEVFFHGTNAESAQSIIEEGIKLPMTPQKRTQDFSHKDGFYVSKDFGEALVFAAQRHSQGAEAVITFRVKRSELRDPEKFNGWDLRKDKEEWKKTVKEFRSGKPNQSLIKDLKKNRVDYCEGPMATISRDRKKKKDDLKWPKPIDDSYQLCVYFKGKCRELFNNSLHSVLFFER